MKQAWTKAGHRLPITVVTVPQHQVVRVVEGSPVVQLGLGETKAKHVRKPQQAAYEKSQLTTLPRHERTVTWTDAQPATVGTSLALSSLLKVGDIVSVAGLTKGRGFSGGMRRWGFGGGARTHGQSDRMRAPGSIGQGTTPGRVYPGKKMAGRYGNERVTMSQLQIVHIDLSTSQVWIAGTLPGANGSMVELRPTDHQEFVGLVGMDTQTTQETSVTEEETETTPEVASQEVKE